LEQRVGTPTQQKWVSKFLGYDFTVEYKRGRDNKAADALSKVPFSEIDANDAGTIIETGADEEDIETIIEIGVDEEDTETKADAETKEETIANSKDAEIQKAAPTKQPNMHKSQVHAISTIRAN
jgi:hypothetical protein